jgi:hypothetical protein
VVVVGEAGDVTNLHEQPCSTRGADALQVQQASAGRGDQRVELLVGGLLALVDPLEVNDQFCRDASTGLPCDVSRSDRREQCFGLGRGQALLRTTRDQFQQHVVNLGDLAGVLIT